MPYASSLFSFDQNHLIKHGVNKNHIEKEKVNSISIKNLLSKDKHKFKNKSHFRTASTRTTHHHFCRNVRLEF